MALSNLSVTKRRAIHRHAVVHVKVRSRLLQQMKRHSRRRQRRMDRRSANQEFRRYRAA